MKSKDSTLNIVTAIAELATLQERLAPILPAASKKLVNDLLSSGVTEKKIASIISRSPSYVRSLASGKAVLTPANFTKVVRNAIMSRPTSVK